MAIFTTHIFRKQSHSRTYVSFAVKFSEISLNFSSSVSLSGFLLPKVPGLESDMRMEIFIQHQGQQTGPFTQQEIQAGLANGTYKTSDLVWYEGAAGWLPLSSAPHILGGGVPAVAVAPAMLGSVPAGGQPENSGLAITSMILGISGFACGITAIPAVICGHIALSKIKQSHGRITGSGFAIAGLITGYLVTLLIILAIILSSVAGLTAPMVIRQRKKADQTEATSNARSFGLALFEFDAEYGSFPNASTAPLVANDSNTTEITGNSSNARFRQLFSAGITQSEQMFYANADGIHKPDSDISGDQALSPGECGFGYIENVSAKDSPRPIALAPFVSGSVRLDPLPFDGKAVVLWSDNSVRSLPIDRATGEAELDGQNILDPTHPVWEGTPPVLLLPE